MPLTVERLLARRESLRTQRANYDSLLEEQAEFIRPAEMGFTGRTPPTPGTKRTRRLFDETAVDACEDFARSLAGGLSNEALKWFVLSMTNEDLNASDEVAEYLEDSTLRLLRALGQSRFYSELLESYQDLGAFGCFAFLLDEVEPGEDTPRSGFRGVLAERWPLWSVTVAEGPDGLVDTVYRDFQMAAGPAVRRWPDTVPDEVRRRATTSPDQPEDWCIAFYPREPGDRWPFPIVQQVLHVSSRTFVAERGHPELPVLVPRWARATNEVYGWGPGRTALPAIRSLNELARLDLRAVGKVVDPPLQGGDRGTIAAVRLMAGGTTYVRPNAELKELQPNLHKFTITEAKLQRLEAKINRMFFRDLTRLPETGPEMTAREVLVRYEIMQRRFGPTLGRMVAEFFDRAIRRVFGLMFRAGALASLPPVLEGQPWMVRYESPLARSQRLAEVDAIESFVTLDVPAVEQVMPGARDVVDGDEALRVIGRIKGVPATILRNRRQVDQRRAVAADLARQAQAKEDAALQAKAIRDVAAAAKDEAAAGPTLRAVA